ncbi:MAG: hypothetical protein ACK42L_05895 [Thermoanaerobaculum sp.]
MVQFRPTAREIVAKIVYYGPPLGGKTTNLRVLHAGYPEEVRGNLIELPAGNDRTIFFDYLPLTFRKLRGMDLRIQLYTVPGQVRFDYTRQQVLRGVDGVVFVADSQREAMQANRDSWANLKKNLALQGLFLDRLPHVLQYNKRDLADIVSVEEMDATLNEFNAPFFEAIAIQGIGVEETLQAIVKLVVRSLRDRFNLGVEGQPALQAVPPPKTEELITRPVPVAPQPLPRLKPELPEPLPPPEITPPTLPFVPTAEPETVVRQMPTPSALVSEEPTVTLPEPDAGVFAAEPPTRKTLPPEPEFVAAEAGEPLPLGPLPEVGEEPPWEIELPPLAESPPPAPWEEPAAVPLADVGLALEAPSFGAEPQEEAAFPEEPAVQLPSAAAPTIPSEEPFAPEVPESEPLAPPALEEAPVVGEAGRIEAAFAEESSVSSAPLPEPLVPTLDLARDPFVVEELPAASSSEDVFALVPRPPVEVMPETAAIERVIPRAVARHGELRELEVEVPVPATWVGGRRVTLQLRLTLVPEEENHEP